MKFTFVNKENLVRRAGERAREHPLFKAITTSPCGTCGETNCESLVTELEILVEDSVKKALQNTH